MLTSTRVAAQVSTATGMDCSLELLCVAPFLLALVTLATVLRSLVRGVPSVGCLLRAAHETSPAPVGVGSRGPSSHS